MKNNFHLISSILRNPWHIDVNYALNHLDFIKSLITKNNGNLNLDEGESRIPAMVMNLSDELGETVEAHDLSEIDHEAIAIINFNGPIMRYDTFCEYGTQTKAQWIQQAEENPNIVGLIGIFDTPGGESTASEIGYKAMKNFTKPSIAIASGSMASGGMMIAMGFDSIYVENKSSFIGSIGTMMMVSKGNEEGIIEVYADDSTNKNIEMRELIKNNNEEPLKNNILNKINEQFKNIVKENRPGVSEIALTGQIFIGSEAIANQLADQEGTIKTAIQSIMFKSKNSILAGQLRDLNGKTVTMSQLSEILGKSNISIAVEGVLPPAKSALFTPTGDEKAIYVYAEEGEDLQGKRCVYADEAGEPTEENVSDGDHVLEDGRTMTTSTHDDGLSYVDSITEAEEPEEPTETETTESETTQRLAKLEAELVELRGKVVLGKNRSTPKQVNQSSGKQFKETAFQKRQKEISQRHQARKRK